MTRHFGTTLGYESLDRDGEKAQIFYLGLIYMVTKNIHIGGSYWSSNQKEEDGFDNLKSSLDFELSAKF